MSKLVNLRAIQKKVEMKLPLNLFKNPASSNPAGLITSGFFVDTLSNIISGNAQITANSEFTVRVKRIELFVAAATELSAFTPKLVSIFDRYYELVARSSNIGPDATYSPVAGEYADMFLPVDKLFNVYPSNFMQIPVSGTAGSEVWDLDGYIVIEVLYAGVPHLVS